MRYMCLGHGNQQSESFTPTPEAIEEMGKHVEQAIKEGWLLATEGLLPSRHAVNVKVEAGKQTVTDGPFTEAKELIASYAIINVASKEEAIERCVAFLNLIGGGETDLYQMYDEG
ncbi:MAG: hypothetical protein JO247_05585 [Chloroflexi bacterium]|nr:hypothetical protein [Chloroflexota bacterium]